MTAAVVEGFRRSDGRVGARDNFFIMPSVVCSALVARQIADAVGATSVSHQDGCGHIGADIVQTRNLFVGLATNPNVGQSMVISLGCETVQGAQIAKEIEARSYITRFVSIQNSGGNDLAREAGVKIASKMREELQPAERVPVDLRDLVIGIAASASDTRTQQVIDALTHEGAKVIVAGRSDIVGATESIVVGQEATAAVSVVRDAGSGAQLLAALASCGAQVLLDVPASQQPPQGFPLAPVVSVSSGQGLHKAIEGDFDVEATADATTIVGQIIDVFSGAKTRAELRGSASFAIPRLLRTM